MVVEYHHFRKPPCLLHVKKIGNKLVGPRLGLPISEATPLQQLLIERSGFLLGLEAPKPLDPEKSKVPEVWRVEDGCGKHR